ncbi:MAG: Sua5 family C-terminal domain-containing protein, partial [Pseudomonadales bacterium]
LRPGLLRPGLLRPGLLRPRLLRPGMIGRSAIEQVLGVRVATDAHGAVRVPGQHDRHYAPGTPAWRFGSPDAAALRNPRLGWLLCGSALEAAGVVLDLGSDPGVYARRFYAALYRLDQAGLEGILVEMPPEDERWRAIRDRIRRATRPVST